MADPVTYTLQPGKEYDAPCDTRTGRRVQAVRLINESPYALYVDGVPGPSDTGEPLAAWYEMLWLVPPDFEGAIIIRPQVVSTSQNPPSYVAIVKYYYDGDTLPRGNWPAPLPRMFNLGQGSIGTTGTNEVNNTGQPAGTTVVSGTPEGANAPELQLTNDGAAILGGGNVTLDNTGKFTAMPAGAIPSAALNGPAAQATSLGGEFTTADDATNGQAILIPPPGRSVSARVVDRSVTPSVTTERELVHYDGTVHADTAVLAETAQGIASGYTIPAAAVEAGYPGADLSGAAPAANALEDESGYGLQPSHVTNDIWLTATGVPSSASGDVILQAIKNGAGVPFRLRAADGYVAAAGIHGAADLETVYDSTPSATAPASLSVRTAQRWTGATDPTKVSGAPTPGECDLWVQDAIAGGTGAAATIGPTGTPNYGYNSYGASFNQAWVKWVADRSGSLTNIGFYVAGDGSTATNMWAVVWSAAGAVLGYAGSGTPSGGSASIGGQKWQYWGIVNANGASASSVPVVAGQTYLIGWHRNTTLTDWSVWQNDQSPFTGFGYNTSGTTNAAASLGTAGTPGANGPPGVYIVVQSSSGSAAHILMWRNGAWQQIV